MEAGPGTCFNQHNVAEVVLCWFLGLKETREPCHPTREVVQRDQVEKEKPRSGKGTEGGPVSQGPS